MQHVDTECFELGWLARSQVCTNCSWYNLQMPSCRLNDALSFQFGLFVIHFAMPLIIDTVAIAYMQKNVALVSIGEPTSLDGRWAETKELKQPGDGYVNSRNAIQDRNDAIYMCGWQECNTCV